MLNTKKLLYILPDVAYIAELLPDKKPNAFVIQNCTQVNGEFLDENEPIAENILKLCKKLEEGETYHLVLPDFLFTNTIVSVAETSDAKIKDYIRNTLLPEIEISTDTHEVETFVLTEIKGESKVQVSALEKSLLTSFRVAADQQKASFSGVSPLSWTLKSVISLEPSISVLQMGSTLFSALHYIGVDQAMQTTVDSPEAIVETIKTLKGAEPSIQTIYLLSNSLVEEKLKELLSDTLPLQQLTSLKEDDTKLPPYVTQIIESGMKTLSISDYPVPQFKVPKATKEDFALLEAAIKKSEGDAMPKSKLPKPKKDDGVEKEDEIQEEKKTEEVPSEKETKKEKVEETTQEETKAAEKKDAETEKEAETPAKVVVASADKIEEPPVEEKPAEKTEEPSKTETPVVITNPTEPAKPDAPKTDSDDAVITQFASGTAAQPTITTAPSSQPSGTIKNKSGVRNMLKMIFITIAVFFVTVAVGIGVGMAILRVSGDTDVAEQSPVTEENTEETPQEEPEPSPTPEPTAELDKTEVSLLVVNATTKAGYAGTVSDDLEAGEFEDVTASNAKGEYEETGVFLLLDEENQALVDAVAEATDLEVTALVGEEKETEDPSGKYTAVLVLAE